MPTNEQRREIAKRLRDFRLGSYSTACLVCAALSIDDMCRKDCDPERRLLDVAHAISDIIEPEPERTCRMIDNGCELCCSLCDTRHDYDDQPNYCMGCGAKVVNDAD